MPKVTKAELEERNRALDQALQSALDEIAGLKRQINEGVAANPQYQQALKDAEAARQDAEMWRGMYDKLAEKVNTPPEPPKAAKAGRPIYKVFPETREAILQDRHDGLSLRAIAKKYGLSLRTIQKVCDTK